MIEGTVNLGKALTNGSLFQVKAESLNGAKFKLKNNKVISLNEVRLNGF